MTARTEADSALRRLERNALIVWAAMAAAALALRRGHPDAAIGVAGGGLLSAASYLAIKRAVDGAVAALGRGAAADRPSRWAIALLVLGIVARLALLAVAAYGMLAVLRLHPIGLVAGVSAPFFATIAELIGLARSSARRGRPT